MDRSFLSQPAVIAASRRFVCVRLATYEDAAEAAFLTSFAAGRSGALENTVVCILSPDGREKLVRAARGTEQLYRDAAAMAAAMDRIAGRFAPRPAAGPPALPAGASARLALH